MQYKIKVSILCNHLWNLKAKSNKDKINDVIKELNVEELYNENQVAEIKYSLLNYFLPPYEKKWQAANRTKSNFLSKFNNYLTDFIINLKNSDNFTEDIVNNSSPEKKVGRPRSMYEDSSNSTKRKLAQELADVFSEEELIHALKLKKKENQMQKIHSWLLKKFFLCSWI